MNVQLTGSQTSTPIDLYQGVDQVTNEALSIAVHGKQKTISGNSELEYVFTKSTTELYNTLNISSSISSSYGLASFDSKVQFAKQLNVTNESLCIIVKASDKQFVYQTVDFELESKIKPPSNQDEVVNFVKKYGNAFVSQLTMGGEYYAAYVFYTETIEERASLEASLKASGFISGGSLSADMSVKLDNYCKNTKTSVSFYQMVSGLTNPKLPTNDQIFEYAINFFNQNIDNPAVISYSCTSYDRVPGFPADVFDQIRKNVDYFTLSTGDFTRKLQQLNNLTNHCQHLIDIYKTYDYEKDSRVYEVKDAAEIDIGILTQQMTDYTFAPTAEYTLPSTPSLDSGLPNLQVKFSFSNKYGGNGGGEFNDIPDAMGYIQNKTRISKIQLRSGKRVDAITTEYISANPYNSTYSYTHGGNGGGAGNILNLNNNTKILKISGRSGGRIDQLIFDTNNGGISGGGSGGGPFEFQILEDSCVMGFSGRSGKELDSLTIQVVTFSPAIWKK